jgi:folate-binding protein YgfZ
MPAVSATISFATAPRVIDGPVACDLAPLAVLGVSGLDAATFLHGQVSSDVAGLDLDGCQYASYNSPSGRMLANFPLWRAGTGPADGFRALVAEDIAEAVRRRLAMFVMRAKVTLADLSHSFARFGVAGPGADGALRAAFGDAPVTFGVVHRDETDILGLPGPRFVVVTPSTQAEAVAAALGRVAQAADFAAWQWLTIRAGVPVVTAAVQDRFIPQAVNWDALDGISFQKGCYTGQEIIARTQYLGRLKERLFLFHAEMPAVASGERLYSATFGDQPCGTVVNAAPAPGGGTDLLAVVQIAAQASADVRVGAPDGPPLSALPLPYAIPAPAEPRGRGARAPARN